ILGLFISVVVSLVFILIRLRKQLQKNWFKTEGESSKKRGKQFLLVKKIIAIILVIASVVIFIHQMVFATKINANLVYLIGVMVLFACVFLFDIQLNKKNRAKKSIFNIQKLGFKSLAANKSQSLAVIWLLSIGVFLVITTGANRKDLMQTYGNKSSGTGGYSYFAESTIPVLHDLNDKNNKFDFGIPGAVSFVQFNRFDGDEANCLNLNRIANPSILGVNPQQLQGRFSFATKTDELDAAKPWLSLNQDNGEVIPAIADQTVIQWSLGKKVGDTLRYVNYKGDTVLVRLVGGLAASVFQGNIIIAKAHFQEHFKSEGSHVYLIESDKNNNEDTEESLHMAFRDFGWEMQRSDLRLAEFKSVENTYLDIFMLLGSFGLLIGIVGIAILIGRNLWERKSELALYLSMGYRIRNIMVVFLSGYLGLFIYGLFSGALASVMAIFPSLFLHTEKFPFLFILFIVSVLMVNGVVWLFVISRIQIARIKPTTELKNE
ncbi:MAG: hypothetical protein MI922_26475, partial [Bacteroidales bacterium]|nr:hypothetical protein [Bacteroidales bacterium]